MSKNNRRFFTRPSQESSSYQYQERVTTNSNQVFVPSSGGCLSPSDAQKRRRKTLDTPTTTTTTTTWLPPTTTSTTTTTTTSCRPDGLSDLRFRYQLQDVNTQDLINFSDSIQHACSYLYEYIFDPVDYILIGKIGQIASYATGSIVYDGLDGCNLLSNGYYVTDIDNKEISHVLDGYIVGITRCPIVTTSTTTTTTTSCRPTVLTNIEFKNSIQNLISQEVVDFTSNITDACSSLNTFTSSQSNYVLNGIMGQVQDFVVGSTAWAGIGIDCSVLNDGYYITNPLTAEVTNISGGIIQSIQNCSSVCRPGFLYTKSFQYSIEDLNTNISITFSDTLNNACTSIDTFLNDQVNYMLHGFVGQLSYFEVGSTVYYGLGSDCTLVDDGYYVTNIVTREVVNIVGGVIQSIENCVVNTSTTTTTTTSCRPSSLTNIQLCYSIQINGQDPIVFTDAFASSCSYLDTYLNDTVNNTLNCAVGQVQDFVVGATAWYGVGVDCGLISDGYYVTNTETREITYILNGVIQSIDYCQPMIGFVSQWQTTNPSEMITLPYDSSGTYSGVIYWGDGSTSSNIYGYQSHTYSTPSLYTISIDGEITGWSFMLNATTNRSKIKSILQWGNFNTGNLMGAFFRCNNLTLDSVNDTPNMVSVNNIFEMFYGCSSLTKVNNLNNWNMSGVTSLNAMFEDCTLFDQTITWDFSVFQDISFLFAGTSFTNGGSTAIGDWNTSNVTNMSGLFSRCSTFNYDITRWNVSNVSDMVQLFEYTSFNQPIGNWNVSNVQTMGYMFNSTPFNQPIGSWSVLNVNAMNSMFRNAFNFNQDISNWNISSVINFDYFMSGKATYSYLDSIYNKWSTLSVQPGSAMVGYNQNGQYQIPVDFGCISSTTASQAARNILTGGTISWIIIDGSNCNVTTSTTTTTTTLLPVKTIFMNFGTL